MPARIPFRPIDQFEGKTPSELERSTFYNSPRWRKLRKRYLSKHPVCQECEREFSNTVHHVEARLDHPSLAFAWSNLKAMCGPCHTRYEAHHRSPAKTGPDSPQGGADATMASPPPRVPGK